MKLTIVVLTFAALLTAIGAMVLSLKVEELHKRVQCLEQGRVYIGEHYCANRAEV